MKFRVQLFAGLFLFAWMAVFASPALAQAETPPGDTPTQAVPSATPVKLHKGEITGKIVNQNDPGKLPGEIEVMLHILDEGRNELGMLHGKSAADGSYRIVDVPIQMGLYYAAVVVYENTPYVSEIIPAETGKQNLELPIHVYESTTDLSGVRIDQMNVIFNLDQDGVEVKELYGISNIGDRTVKGGIELTDGKKGTLRFDLPEEAKYLFLQPETVDRFVKFPGGFADTSPLVPGLMVNQLMASYLLPYREPFTFTYSAPVDIQRVNLVIPKEFGVTLQGEGMTALEPVTGQDGKTYLLYQLDNVDAGKTFLVSMIGKPVFPESEKPLKKQEEASFLERVTAMPNAPIVLGIGGLGLLMALVGGFVWVRSTRNDDEDSSEEEEILEGEGPEFENLIAEITSLDEAYEQDLVDEAEYFAQREELLVRARALAAEPQPANVEIVSENTE